MAKSSTGLSVMNEAVVVTFSLDTIQVGFWTCSVHRPVSSVVSTAAGISLRASKATVTFQEDPGIRTSRGGACRQARRIRGFRLGPEITDTAVSLAKPYPVIDRRRTLRAGIA